MRAPVLLGAFGFLVLLSSPAKSLCPNWDHRAEDVQVTITPDPGCVDVALVGELQDCERPRIEITNGCDEPLEVLEPAEHGCQDADCATIDPAETESFFIPDDAFIASEPQVVHATMGADEVEIIVGYTTVDHTPASAEGCSVGSPGRGLALSDGLFLAVGLYLGLRRRRRFDPAPANPATGTR